MAILETNREDAINNIPDLDNHIPVKSELELLKDALIAKGVITAADIK